MSVGGVEVITPHHQPHMLQSLRPAGEGRVYTAAMWALKNKEKLHEYCKSLQLSIIIPHALLTDMLRLKNIRTAWVGGPVLPR